MTGAQWVTASMELIGVHSPADGDVSPADQATALFHGNLWRTSRNARMLALAVIERQALTWPVSTSSRTIGAAGELVGTRPELILHAKVIPVGQASELHVDVMTHAQYAAIGDKTQTATYFSRLLYERTGAAVGTITVWPVPTSAPTLVLHNKVPMGVITADDEIVVQEEYKAALVSQLAKRLAPIFTKSWTKELEEIAREDWAIVQSANIRIPEEKGMPAGFPGTRRGGVSGSDYDAGTF